MSGQAGDGAPALERVRIAWLTANAGQAQLTEAVARARADGASWESIGEAAGGMTRQSAHERWSKTVDTQR